MNTRRIGDALCALAAGAVLLAGTITAQADTAFYVAPPPTGVYANGGDMPSDPTTLEGARDKIRAVSNRGQNFYVHLLDGTYTLSSTFTLTQQDSVPDPCKIQFLAENPGKALISGGDLVTGWSQIGAINGVPLWKTTMVSGGFRDLYHNNMRLTRARHPNLGGGSAGYAPILAASADGLFFTMGIDTSAMTQPFTDGAVEMVARSQWVQYRQIVPTGASGATTSVAFGHPLGSPGTILAVTTHNDAYLENSLAFVDQDGEWYGRPGAVKGLWDVWLLLSGNPNSLQDFIVAPRLETLVAAEQSQNVQFINVLFAFTNSPLPNRFYPYGSGGYVDDPVHVTINRTFHGALEFHQTTETYLQGCRIAHTGGNGILISSPVPIPLSNPGPNWIEGCKIFDLGGSAVRVGDGPDLLQSQEFVGTHWITDCHIEGFGVTYPDHVGVWIARIAQTSQGAAVNHNEVLSGGYSGIRVGQDLCAPNDRNFGVQVDHNNIYGVMGVLTDGAAIYMSGPIHPACSVTNNWIHGMPAACQNGRGLYWDLGSTNWAVCGNVVEGTAQPTYFNYLCSCGDPHSDPNCTCANPGDSFGSSPTPGFPCGAGGCSSTAPCSGGCPAFPCLLYWVCSGSNSNLNYFDRDPVQAACGFPAYITLPPTAWQLIANPPQAHVTDLRTNSGPQQPYRTSLTTFCPLIDPIPPTQ